MVSSTSLLIVGAGPFGLAAAAFAQRFGIDHFVAGRPLQFWRRNMPQGMLLRSGVDWHLDPLEEDTIVAFLAGRGQTAADVEPLALELYLEYAAWFQERKGIETSGAMVSSLDRVDGAGFVATLDDGTSLRARNVLLATGFASFAHTPPELAALFPQARVSHTCWCNDLAAFAGKRCLIIGGRQSAFEWAALLRENGAAAVYVCHRHETPSFVESDWSWVNETVARIADEPTWYRNLPPVERRQLDQRFWNEGRGKLEPWLRPRLEHPEIHLFPLANPIGCDEAADDSLEVTLDSGAVLAADHVILATGYKVDMARVPFLSEGVLGDMKTAEGFPVLDHGMQTTVPGLYVTSLPAARDFGLFFGFTSAVRASAKIVGNSLLRAQADRVSD